MTDSEGKPVAVRWIVSGLGCYGGACGNIDNQGVYQPPSALPKPRVVTLEGVLVSDPHYSVLTEIRLEDAVRANVSPAPAEASADKPQLVAALAVGKQDFASRVELMPIPRVVAAAPEAGGANISRAAGLPLPSAIAAAPLVGKQGVARRSELPPVPPAVAATPAVEGRDIVHAADLPLPSAIAAAPLVGKQGVARRSELPPVPPAVAATPAVEGRDIVHAADLPLPSAIAAAPLVGKQGVTRRSELPPVPPAVAATPAVEGRDIVHAADLPLPFVIAVTPLVGKQGVAGRRELPPVPPAVAATPAIKGRDIVQTAALLPLASAISPRSPSPEVFTVRAPPAPAAARQNTGGRAGLLPLPDEVGAAPAGAILNAQPGASVTYRDGQLMIDARNSTLAEVLRLVAQKTGAKIEVPPGTGLERIVEHVGPGPAKDVLAHLLNGSSFNFIIVSSPQRPQDPAEVLLSLQQPDTGSPSPAPAPKTVASSALWTPPEDTSVQVLPAHLEENMTVPKETMTPEARSEFMKAKMRELIEKANQQYPPQ